MTSSREYKHIFGPVPSRRFGRSLGVDLIPMKTCTFDCVFCQVGRTSELTALRREYVPVEEVTAELKHWKENNGRADFITLAGSGEPTLNSRFGDVVRFVKDSIGIPMLILTNGSLLHLPEVRSSAAHADIVKVSLSAWDQESYRQINRPCHEIHFDRVVEGERAFRREFKGKLWLEVFVLNGINSEPEQIARIAEIARGMEADRIQLNTAVRPPAEGFAEAVSRKQLEDLTKLFDPPAEIIASFKNVEKDPSRIDGKTILSMLARRPCTAQQMADVSGTHVNEVLKHVGGLLESDSIVMDRRGDQIYYVSKAGERS